MPISIQCGSCRTTLKAPDASAGKTLPCPKCRQPVSIPATSQQAAPIPPAVDPSLGGGTSDIDALLGEIPSAPQGAQGFGPMGGQAGGFPQQGFPQQGFPQQGMPQGGFPQQGFPQQGGHPGYGAARPKKQLNISQYLPKSSWGYALLGAGLGFGLGIFLIVIASVFRIRF